MQMQAVTTIVVDRFYKQLERTKPVECNGRKPRTEKLTPANIEKIHKLIRCAFDQAVRWEVIGRNPFSGALIPKHVAKKRAMWTIQTIVKAMDECTDAKLYLAMNLAFACSMREGEILGLQWDRVHISDADIANDDAHLYVDCELARVNKQAMEKLEDKGILFKFPSIMSNCRSTVLVLKVPKTESSVRKIWIPKTLAYILREWKKSQDNLKEMLGEEFIELCPSQEKRRFAGCSLSFTPKVEHNIQTQVEPRRHQGYPRRYGACAGRHGYGGLCGNT